MSSTKRTVHILHPQTMAPKLLSNLWNRHVSLSKTWAVPQKSSERWKSTDWPALQPMLTMLLRCILMIVQSFACKKAKRLSRCLVREVKSLFSTCARLLAIKSRRGNSKTIFKFQWSSLTGSFWQTRSRNTDKCKRLSKRKPSSLRWTKFKDHSTTFKLTTRLSLLLIFKSLRKRKRHWWRDMMSTLS